MTKRIIIIRTIIVLTFLVIVLLIIREISEPAEEIPIAEPEEISEPEGTPRFVRPLAYGKQGFEIITAGRTFKMVEVELDPLDVKKGEIQQVTVWVEDTEDNPITSENKVEGIAFTDNKEMPFSFELKEVSDANGGTLTEWEGSWILGDSYDKIYVITIIAKSAKEQHKIDLTLR